MLASMNLPTSIAVGTADAGSFFNNEVLENVAYGVCVLQSTDSRTVLTLRADVQRPPVVR